jgi:hypothetical protein
LDYTPCTLNKARCAGRQEAGRNLLFGLLALWNNFISRDVLVAAFGIWVARKSRLLERAFEKPDGVRS